MSLQTVRRPGVVLGVALLLGMSAAGPASAKTSKWNGALDRSHATKLSFVDRGSPITKFTIPIIGCTSATGYQTETIYIPSIPVHHGHFSIDSSSNGPASTRPSCARTGTALAPTRRWSGSTRCPSICFMVAVTAVEPLADYTLRLTFDDGSERVVDLADELWGPMGEPLRDRAYFRQVRVDPELRTVVWPNGFDLDPDVLHGHRSQETPPAARPQPAA